MTLILKKVWVLFVVAMILVPCLVEAFNLSGTEVLPKFVDGIPVHWEFLNKEAHEFKEIFTSVYGPLFSWFKGNNELFGGFGSKVCFGAISIVEDLPEGYGGETNGGNDGRYDWCIQFIFYLSLFGSCAYYLFRFVLFEHNDLNNPPGHSP